MYNSPSYLIINNIKSTGLYFIYKKIAPLNNHFRTCRLSFRSWFGSTKRSGSVFLFWCGEHKQRSWSCEQKNKSRWSKELKQPTDRSEDRRKLPSVLPYPSRTRCHSQRGREPQGRGKMKKTDLVDRYLSVLRAQPKSIWPCGWQALISCLLCWYLAAQWH